MKVHAETSKLKVEDQMKLFSDLVDGYRLWWLRDRHAVFLIDGTSTLTGERTDILREALMTVR